MKVIIIDDDPLVSQALRAILETDPDIVVPCTGSDGSDALPLYEAHQPDVLLMDIRMKNVSGLSGGEAVLRKYPDARIFFLTTFSDDDYIVKALRIGARGYLLKQSFDSIIPSLRAVMSGQSVFGGDIAARISCLQHPSEKKNSLLPAYSLTQKEISILELIAEGKSNREIAEQLYTSEGTLRNSISILLEKLELKSRTQLAIFYLKKEAGIED
jgi:DNA-binding NarL/FixJ family response regulator